jgi:general secretion pathway protein K
MIAPPHHEQGAALINVLVLVGILSALAAGLFDRLRLARHLDGARGAADAAQAAALAGEALLLARLPGLRALPAAAVALPGGATAQLSPGGNCFNLNSLAMGPAGVAVARPLGIAQFIRLLVALEVPDNEASRIAAATADWIDADQQPQPGGAEDPAYARAVPAYRTGGTLMADVSEWRAVAGVTPALYARVAPHLCALPAAELSRPNVNSLAPGHAPVLAAIAGVPLATARAAIAARPRGGWASLPDFWNQPLLAGRTIAADALRQPQLRDSHVAFSLSAGGVVVERGLIDATPGQPPRLLARVLGAGR